MKIIYLFCLILYVQPIITAYPAVRFDTAMAYPAIRSDTAMAYPAIRSDTAMAYPAIRSDTAMAYVPPMTSTNIQYDQLIIYYNTPLCLNRTTTTIDMFDSNSNTMYNCSIYDNG